MVVASSPVRTLIEEHAGEHLNNYRGIVAECAHQKLTLTHAQTGERRETFTERIVNVIVVFRIMCLVTLRVIFKFDVKNVHRPL